MAKTVWTGVIAREQFAGEVEAELRRLYERLKVEHPEWGFDIEGPHSDFWQKGEEEVDDEVSR